MAVPFLLLKNKKFNDFFNLINKLFYGIILVTKALCGLVL